MSQIVVCTFFVDSDTEEGVGQSGWEYLFKEGYFQTERKYCDDSPFYNKERGSNNPIFKPLSVTIIDKDGNTPL